MASRSRLYDAAIIAAILTGGLNIGLSMGILGPTLPDLAQQTGVSLLTASTLSTCRAITFIIGSLVSGVLLQHVEGYVALTPVLLLQAITTALSGWFSSFLLIALFQSASNLFATIMVTGVPLLVFSLENARARIVAQVAFLLFNVGKTIVPFIVAPFLSYSQPTNTTTTILPTLTTVIARTTPIGPTQNTSVTHLNELDDILGITAAATTGTQVKWAYVIVGFYCLIMTFLYGGIALANGCKWRVNGYSNLKDENDKEESQKKKAPPPQPPSHSRTRMVLAIGLFLLAIFMQSGMETIDNALLMSFVTEYMHLPKMTGLIMTSIYQGIKVVICLGIIFIVNKVHPSTIIFVDILCMILGTGLMTGAVLMDHEAFFYVTIVILAIGMSNYYATILSWVRVYYPINGWLSSLISVFFGLSAVGQPPLTTGLLEAEGPVAFPAVLLVSAILCIVLWVVLKLALKEPMCPKMNLPRPVSESENVVSEGSPLLSAKTPQSTFVQSAG